MTTNTTARTPGPLYVRTNRHPSTNGQPWGWIDRSPGPQQRSIDGLRIEWNGEQGHANAAFIVRAANSHDELVAALGSLLSFCDATSSNETEYEQCVTTARAALAKARQP